MAKKKVEHVVFDGMRKVRKKINISEFNKNTHVEKRKQRDAGINTRLPTLEEHHKDR
ncbi:MAG: hypothetical protein J5522_10470 [Lachnospiraceae bacterium]|nr:hypothetical protein [Lachnospiraceae bacterium]